MKSLARLVLEMNEQLDQDIVNSVDNATNTDNTDAGGETSDMGMDTNTSDSGEVESEETPTLEELADFIEQLYAFVTDEDIKKFEEIIDKNLLGVEIPEESVLREVIVANLSLDQATSLYTELQTLNYNIPQEAEGGEGGGSEEGSSEDSMVDTEMPAEEPDNK